MADQVQGLRARGIAAEALTAGLRQDEAERILDNARFGPGGFLFVAPERLSQPDFQIGLPSHGRPHHCGR